MVTLYFNFLIVRSILPIFNGIQGDGERIGTKISFIKYLRTFTTEQEQLFTRGNFKEMGIRKYNKDGEE